MVGLTLLVASIAAADSVNPSTIIPALWLASAGRGRGLASYTAGVFAVYLAGGIVLVIGPGPALIRSLRHLGGPLEHALEAGGGVVALAFALALWRSRGRERAKRQPVTRRTRVGAFALGAGIMALELPTAFMYFGAISAILSSHRAGLAELLLLITYNALFVAPLLAILAVRRIAAERAERWLIAGEQWVRRFGGVVVPGVAGAAGAVLVTLGVSGFVTA